MSSIYHYTSLDATIKILQKDKICFWGTRYDSMNDPTDYIYAKDIVIPLLKNVIDIADVDAYDKDDLEAFPYIVSFSNVDDDFNMWRMYNADVALEFDRAAIKNHLEHNTKEFVFLEECCYPGIDEIHRMFAMKLDTINIGQGLMLAARHTLAFIKRKNYINEHEVRLVAFDHAGATFHKGEIIEQEIAHDIGIRTIRNKDLVLYKEFLLPKEALTGIIINSNGEKHYESLKKHLQLWLLQQNYNHNITIRKSETGAYINLNI